MRVFEKMLEGYTMTEIQAMKWSKHVLNQVKRLLKEGFSDHDVRLFLANTVFELPMNENIKRKPSKWDKPRGRPRL